MSEEFDGLDLSVSIARPIFDLSIVRNVKATVEMSLESTPPVTVVLTGRGCTAQLDYADANTPVMVIEFDGLEVDTTRADARRRDLVINSHERRAWRALVDLGAKEMEIGGLQALDLSAVRVRSERDCAAFVDAVLNVAGRSGANRRHENRHGQAVYVVTDDENPKAPEPIR